MRLVVFVAVGALFLGACSTEREMAGAGRDALLGETEESGDSEEDGAPIDEDDVETASGDIVDDSEPITLAFAGDVHFEGALTSLPEGERSTLGRMSDFFRKADLAMVNLESPVTTRGRPASKELEVPGNRFWFRSPPEALGVLARSGVDVVSVANNHGADYGERGLRDTLRAAADSRVSVVGAGLDEVEAFTPYRETIKGNDVAVFAADSSFRESTDPIWGVLPGTGPGIASARGAFNNQLTNAVSKAAAVDDVVVVYLHWGDEGASCPTLEQRVLARTLAAAGADIVVGAHTHTPVAAGLIDSTYVSYGLGNFLWYNGSQRNTGVLSLTVNDGEVTADTWNPGEIPAFGGQPTPLTGRAAETARDEWRGLRSCTSLEPGPSEEPELPPYEATIAPIDDALRQQMIGNSHDPATCPVPLSALRRLLLSYVDFDGVARRGVMVVHREVARDVVDVFRTLYEARFPIKQMRRVDAFGGDDNASMAANNTSAYNCRTVAGTSTFSDHAYGKAIDINPLQNPYVLGSGDVLPPGGERFVGVDRSRGARIQKGVIGADGVVKRAFDRIGWSWGGNFSDPDYQHFSTS